MTFSLFELAHRLERRGQRRRTLKRLEDVQNDPHLARDVGLPYRPHEPLSIDKW